MAIADHKPHVILILNGKRKSGKDFISSKLLLKFGEEIATLVHLSGPLKSEYAREHSLDYESLMGTDNYKETHRADMIIWGERKRDEDPGYFCRLATESPWVLGKKVWIVCDARRPSDLEYFRTLPNANVITIRITAEESTRKKRGFAFVAGIDDAASECGLDHIKDWDYVLDNSTGKDVDLEVDKLITFLDERADSVGDADII